MNEAGQTVAETPTASGVEAGTVLDGRYKIVEKLGSGGVGDVYVAEHMRLKRKVAVKVLQSNYATSNKLRLRFEREAQALAMMAHPNIVTIADYGVSDDVPFLAMELLQGEPLSSRIKRGALDSEVALDIAAQVLRALGFAHDEGWVHRDLKPGNIFLQPLLGGAIHVKILDFGLAKLVTADDEQRHGPKLTMTGMVFGTPAYMSPEQAVGSSADARTDIYAMGVVLFEMLAGRRVFEGDGDQLMRQHLQAAAPRLEEVHPTLRATAELDLLLTRSLAKERGDRYQSAAEMLEAIEALPDPAVLPQDAVPTSPVDATGATMMASVEAFAGQVSEQPTRNALPTPSEMTGQPAGAAAAPAAAAAGAAPAAAGAAPRPRVGLIGVIAGLIAGIVAAVPLTCVVMGIGSEGEAEVQTPAVTEPPEPESSKALGWGPPEPPPTQPDAAESAKAALGPGRRPGGPWSDPDVPEAVAEGRAEVAKGQQLSGTAVRALRRYALRNSSDPRPYIVLARHHVLRGALSDGIDRYERAFAADESARYDPQMLYDLIELTKSNSVGFRAAQAIQKIYGDEALERVNQTLADPELDNRARRRFERLKQSLRSGS